MSWVSKVDFSLHRTLVLVLLAAAFVAGSTPADAEEDPTGSQPVVQVETAGILILNDPDDLPAPEPPQLDGWAGPDRGQIELTWHQEEVVENPAQWMIGVNGGLQPIRNYTLYVSEDPTEGFEPLVRLPGNETGFVHEGLEDGQRRYYRVAAENEFGEGSPSKTVTLTTWSVPGRVSFVWATQDGRDPEIRLDWLPPAQDGGLNLTHYVVYSSTDPKGPFEAIARVEAATRTFTHSGVEGDETHYYRVAAANELGPGIQSASVQALGPTSGAVPPLPDDRVPDPECVIRECPADPTGDEGGDRRTTTGGPQEEGGDTGKIAGSVSAPERAVDPRVIAGVAVGAATVFFPLVRLYRRITGKSVLEQTLRRAIYEQILEHPGATTADLARSLRLHYSTVRHHLELLHHGEEVQPRKFHGRLRWFPNHRTYGVVAKAAAAALAVDSQRRIIRELSADPGIAAGEIARRLGLAPATVSHHLKRLTALGLVERRRQAQWVRYSLAPEVPKALKVLKMAEGATPQAVRGGLVDPVGVGTETPAPA